MHLANLYLMLIQQVSVKTLLGDFDFTLRIGKNWWSNLGSG